MRKLQRGEYENKINGLNSTINQLNSTINQLKEDLDFQKNTNETEKEKLSATSQAEKLVLEEKIKNLQSQLDKKELKKLAEAHRDQEVVYESGASKWLKFLLISAVLLFLSVVASTIIYLTSSRPWHENLEFYLFDMIFVSAVWFCGSQYTDSIRLKNDYANRKTVAQSFHNILNNLEEDEDIKFKFIEKATDVLCAPGVLTNKEPILSKKIIKDIAEIVGSVAKK